jgi:head-tail adaptor
MSFLGLLNMVCDIQAKTNTQTTSGQLTAAWTDTATGVKTTKYRKSPSRTSDKESRVYLSDFTFIFEIGTAIEIGNRIHIDGEYFDVLSASPDSRKHHLEVVGHLIEQ